MLIILYKAIFILAINALVFHGLLFTAIMISAMVELWKGVSE